jgi:thioredoxin-like negative regulator of GroEL
MGIHSSTVAPEMLDPRLDGARRLVVVTLCAAWCNTCTEFRVGLEALAASRPDVAFVWLDIEDDSEVCGDVDVESFPTLLAWRGDAILHFGVTVPHAGVIARLIDELAQRDSAMTDPPPAVCELRAALLREST